MSADMKWLAPRHIDWREMISGPIVATDVEVIENLRALRASYFVSGAIVTGGVKAIDAALKLNDQPVMRQMLNEAEWRLWR